MGTEGGFVITQSERKKVADKEAGIIAEGQDDLKKASNVMLKRINPVQAKATAMIANATKAIVYRIDNPKKVDPRIRENYVEAQKKLEAKVKAESKTEAKVEVKEEPKAKVKADTKKDKKGK